MDHWQDNGEYPKPQSAHQKEGFLLPVEVRKISTVSCQKKIRKKTPGRKAIWQKASSKGQRTGTQAILTGLHPDSSICPLRGTPGVTQFQ